jgi:hypothetical protein
MEKIVDDYIDEKVKTAANDIFNDGLNEKNIYQTIMKVVLDILTHGTRDREDDD